MFKNLGEFIQAAYEETIFGSNDYVDTENQCVEESRGVVKQVSAMTGEFVGYAYRMQVHPAYHTPSSDGDLWVGSRLDIPEELWHEAEEFLDKKNRGGWLTDLLSTSGRRA